MNITPEQISKIRQALWLACYFVQDQDPSKEQTAIDSKSVREAWTAIHEIEKGVTA